ncbi:aminoglycoside phosphotransferase family protein [Streptomyces sp. UNOC14_S4]|uniref:aminoglycoside phosphotransferase family protein n=1 Tax=Streptomyces sp. UNOC14_S4 TaxID=2872340 RepID=UPI001E4A281F|nr:aminoglycoside phosphotransferase family protein [Streptomyces sp. UNOC14_S4]MCC3770390.1 aminoglycoside phosphotransferase family protein [Streptomyces sp. UNOC14_S4]
MASDAARTAIEGLTSAGAAEAMIAACRSVGLDPCGAELIRFGENALFRLASAPVIVRVARSSEYLSSARKEVAVSRWLAQEGFPAARVVDDLEQPVLAGGRPVTFWHLINEGDRKPTYGELGAVLRDLHSLTLPPGLELPPYDVFGRSDLRIDRAPDGVSDEDRQFLRRRLHELRAEVANLRFDSLKDPLHGDAHMQNLMTNDQGHVVLIDFEGFGFDHPEWDLMVTATEHHSLGWQTKEQYADFVTAYGRDLRDWTGFTTLRGVQEFHMTTWLMQNTSEGKNIAEEYVRRLASLRDDDAPRNWRPW